MDNNKSNSFWDQVPSTSQEFTEKNRIGPVDKEKERIIEEQEEKEFLQQYLVDQEQNPTVFGRDVRYAKRKMIKKAGFKKYGQLLRKRLKK